MTKLVWSRISRRPGPSPLALPVETSAQSSPPAVVFFIRSQVPADELLSTWTELMEPGLLSATWSGAVGMPVPMPTLPSTIRPFAGAALLPGFIESHNHFMDAGQAFAQVVSTSGDHDVELVLEPMPNARGDRFLVADLLANLFDNAAKFSRGREKRRVTMRGFRDDGTCCYQIADNGRGFDARLRSAHSHSEGLGLIGMRERAASLGGTLSIDSAPGRGTTLKVVVPLRGVKWPSGSSSPTTT